MILVTPLSAVVDCIRAYRPSHLVTLLSPEHMIDTPSGIRPEHHLRLSLNDISDPTLGEAPPGLKHIAQLIAFGREWDASQPLLVHCWAGVSRSMAATFALLCDRAGPGTEQDIAQEMRGRASHASPNRLLVRLADQTLGREGRMVRAVEAMGPGRMVEEGFPVEFPLTITEP
ncbi:MAG: protein tyrosine phosphatase [Alphaproteobacteria bacterium]|nr:protein tyrosine phosphatase [Alphaproteobacteria bacterium]MDE2161989.1 protein tyrosine phosphatase [Alphaproteobacteria bacterium]MDE2500205.1 protein tyrosine phosphatase [Alphaproteobacteria bacterium]